MKGTPEVRTVYRPPPRTYMYSIDVGCTCPMLPTGVPSVKLKVKERIYLLTGIVPQRFPFDSQTQLHENPCAWVAQEGVPLVPNTAPISMVALYSDALYKVNVTG